MILLFSVAAIPWWAWLLIVLAIVFFRDVFVQRKHAIQHNFPLVGHIRYALEKIGPELRQYIVANNREELPFNRSQRSWVYASSKKQNNYHGFGTDQDIYQHSYTFINNALMPFKLPEGHINWQKTDYLPCAKIMGPNRAKPFRPQSIVNISAMSFGSLSSRAITSLNLGAKKAGAYHNTGEGGYSPYHQNGADVVFQIGTGYFGVRDENGQFSMQKLKQLIEKHPEIRAIELKLSQGAKPGKGGVLPGKKITKEIAAIRGVPVGIDVISPSYHTAFEGVQGMVDFLEDMATETGLPVGIKAAIGKTILWEKLAQIMAETGRGPDFITIDGGEGGTGAAPPSFANHVSLPFVYGFTKVYRIFVQKGITERIVFIGSAKLGFPSQAIQAFAMGADMVNVAREAMMAVGCIQAQSCHTNTCPAGVATQNKWLEAGINVKDKSERVYNYLKTLRKEILEITHSSGYEHPCQYNMDDVHVSLGDKNMASTLRDTLGYEKCEVPFKGMASLVE
ncbi:MAG: FMN-binding glutamate synthase family protein [Bacteroidetes bacterium]|nr:FMN-binding glutamate synthase family protein [Bacteroidota bacterium]